jgi:tetratricopeptide (TPR) repeat protein
VSNADKLCFVVSPIGDEGTPIREEADALLWIIRSATAKYGFKVVRVDEIARSAAITDDIIQMLQQAQLCVMVLSGENANVYYEAGRRHETGKPFIQLIRKGERLPFDVAGIRTLMYDDISATVSAAKLVGDIQRFVDEYEMAGYGTSGSGVSLTSVAAALDRIERKLAQIAGGNVPTGMAHAILPTPGAKPKFGITELLLNPAEALLRAISTGDVQLAEQHLSRLERVGAPENVVMLGALLAAAGSERALESVYRCMMDHYDRISSDVLKSGFGSIVQFYLATDREKEGLERLQALFDRTLSASGMDGEARAFYINQWQRLLYGAGDYPRALEKAEMVLSLAPDNASYKYNASLLYKRMGMLQKAFDLVSKVVDVDDVDSDHLAHAIAVAAELNRRDDARRWLEKLAMVDAQKLAVLQMTDEKVRALM